MCFIVNENRQDLFRAKTFKTFREKLLIHRSSLCIKEMPSWMQIVIKICFSLKLAVELQSM